MMRNVALAFVSRCLGLVVCGILMGVPYPAQAQVCTNPDGAEGDIIYNSSFDVFQGCASTGWKAFHEPLVVPPPTGCPNIGNTCTGANAGMVYAGDYNGNKLYITESDPPSGLAWGPNPSTTGMVSCTGTYTEESCVNGSANTALLKNHASSFPAAEYCADLVAAGYSDWYLPALNELYVVYTNLKAGQPAGTFNFTDGGYWASSDNSTANAWMVRFNDGTHFLNAKQAAPRFRCMRH